MIDTTPREEADDLRPRIVVAFVAMVLLFSGRRSPT
jgi:hypothetical protein